MDDERAREPSFPDDLDADPGDDLGRLLGLSDGMYAFAMTLLAVNVDLPQVSIAGDPDQVTAAVFDLLPQVTVFATSFLLVAVYWNVSRRTFRLIKKNDPTLTWLTLLQLMCVAFLPVASGLFDTHGTVRIVIVLYAGTLLVIGILGQLLWQHAQRAKLLDERATPILVNYYSFRGYATIGVYTLLLLAGIIVPDYARVVLLLLFVYPFLQRIYRFWRGFAHKEQA